MRFAGRTGLCIDEPTPTAIAAAIETLATDREVARGMGAEAGRIALIRFDSRICAARGCASRGDLGVWFEHLCGAAQLRDHLPPVA